jgi:CRP/FNR family cyclic AMP-dependent transcriptional regulator
MTAIATAISLTNSYPVRIDRHSMLRRLSQERAFADCFLDYLLTRNARLQDDVVDHIFNSTEKRLARLLLLLALPECRHHDMPLLPKISQETLATIVGSTRQRVNMLMNRFKRMGVVANGNGLRINVTMLNAFLLE